MERLNLNDNNYNSLESAIHVNRYMLAKDFCKGKVILDIACGEGYGSKLLKTWGAKEVIGVDVAEEAIIKAKQNFSGEGISFIRCDAEQISTLFNKKFDLIISLETIEHISNPSLFLTEIKKTGKKNSIIIITCPNDYHYFPRDDQFNKFHVRKYKFSEFKEIGESILGENCNFYIGTYVKGFINRKIVSEKPKSQIEMLNLEEIKSFEVKSENLINYDDSCYYIGIWNGNITNNSVIFSYKEDNYKSLYEKLYEDYNSIIDQNKKLYNDYKTIFNNLEKYIIMHESLLLEKNYMVNNISKLNKKLNHLNCEINFKDSYIREKEEQTTFLQEKLLKKEEYINKVNNNTIFKFLLTVRRLFKKIINIFGGKND